jgi:hypothetical protein
MRRGQELAPGEDHVGVVIEYPERSDAAAPHYSHVELPRLLVSLLSVWRCHKLTYSQNPSILLHCAQSSAECCTTWISNVRLCTIVKLFPK